MRAQEYKRLLFLISSIFFGVNAMEFEKPEDKLAYLNASKQTQWAYQLLNDFNKELEYLKKSRNNIREDEFLRDFKVLDSYIRELGDYVICNAFFDEIEKKNNYYTKESRKRKIWGMPWQKSAETNSKTLLSVSLWDQFIQALRFSKVEKERIRSEEDLYSMNRYKAVTLLENITLKRKEMHDTYAASGVVRKSKKKIL